MTIALPVEMFCQEIFCEHTGGKMLSLLRNTRFWVRCGYRPSSERICKKCIGVGTVIVQKVQKGTK